MEQQESMRRHSLVGPLFLITVGLVFLASNLGFLTSSAWDTIFRLWPLLLVAAGAELLLGNRLGRSPWATLFSLLILAAVLGLVATLAMVPLGRVMYDDGFRVETTAPWSAQQRVAIGGALHSEEVSQPLEGARRAEVELNFGVGLMKLGAMSESDGLIAGNLILGDEERVTKDFRVRGDTARFRLHSESIPLAFGNGGSGGDERSWDLRLNTEVPTELKVNGGVGKVEMDLSRLNLTGLEVHSGVSNTEITMPGKGRLRANLEGGVGALTVLVPRGMAARIQVEKGLTSVEVTGSYRQQGNVYTSPGYSDAANRLDLTIKGGIGKIVVQESEAA